jgi:hypothetical protein
MTLQNSAVPKRFFVQNDKKNSTVPKQSDGTGLVKLQPSESVLKQPNTVLTVSDALPCSLSSPNPQVPERTRNLSKVKRPCIA